MATRASKNLQNATIMTFMVASGQVATKGRAMLLSGAETTVGLAGAASDAAIGIALETAAAGKEVQIALFGPVVPMLVGTGGTAYGVKQVLVADGITDSAAHNSDGTGNASIVGIALQTGAAADMVGVVLCAINRGV